MLSIGCLALFNLVVLLVPPAFLTSVLELMDIPFSGRVTLVVAVVVNIVLSVAFERWGAPAIAQLIDYLSNLRRRHRVRDGKTYKAIEGAMH